MPSARTDGCSRSTGPSCTTRPRPPWTAASSGRRADACRGGSTASTSRSPPCPRPSARGSCSRNSGRRTSSSARSSPARSTSCPTTGASSSIGCRTRSPPSRSNPLGRSSSPSWAPRWSSCTPRSASSPWPPRRWPRCIGPGSTTGPRWSSRSSVPGSTIRCAPTWAWRAGWGGPWRPAAHGPGRSASAGCSTSSAATWSRSSTTTPRPTTCPRWRPTWPSSPVSMSRRSTASCPAGACSPRSSSPG